MYTDFFGMAPKWWQWTISGLMVAGGIVLVATGAGGVLGGALICAGANSIIGSYLSEASGGSSLAGWAGGMATGMICGAGAGFGGMLFNAAAETAGTTCLLNLGEAIAVPFVAGVVGNTTGEIVSATIDKKELEPEEVITSSLLVGSLNTISAMVAGTGAGIADFPKITQTPEATANAIVVGITVVAEAIVDFLNTIAEFFGKKW